MSLNTSRITYVKINLNVGREKFFALLDGVESDLEDDIDELMNTSDTEFVFEKEDSEKDDVSESQPKNILIPEPNNAIFQMLSAFFCPLFHFKIIMLLKVFYNFTEFLHNFI